MTTTINNEHKELNFSSEREQSQACLNSAEREKNQGRKVLNVPNLRFKEFQGEWEKTKIGDIAIVVGGGTPDTNTSQYWNGKIQWFTPSEIGRNKYVYNSVRTISEEGLNKSSAKLLPIGTILLSSRATVGECSINKKECTTNQGFQSLIPKENISNEFVYYLIQTKRKDLIRKSCGSTFLEISANEVRKIVVSIPTIKEQDKIAKLLSLLDERIATQNKIIDKLQSLIKGINQRVFMNNGINYKLGEVCEIRSGYSGNQLLSKKGLKVSRIETISGHKVNLERVGYVAPFESSENYKLQVGDILFSNINSVEYIGNTAFIDKDYDLYHGMNLLRLTPNNMVVIPFYLYLLLNTNRMLNRFKTVCNKAVSQASINQTELGKTVVQIPDINAQKQICELYQALYDKLESEKYANSLFQKQKQYLLRQMFI